jgi:hypothetical protein
VPPESETPKGSTSYEAVLAQRSRIPQEKMPYRTVTVSPEDSLDMTVE